MTDECDAANDLRDLELAHALASRELPPRGLGSAECEICGDPMPEPRRAMGYSTCIECAEREEAARRLRGLR